MPTAKRSTKSKLPRVQKQATDPIARPHTCGKILIIENEKLPGRITVVMIGEALGY